MSPRPRHSDNLTLVPASQLPFKDEWDRIAAELPARHGVLIAPEAGSRLAHSIPAITAAFRSRGRHIAIHPSRSLRRLGLTVTR